MMEIKEYSFRRGANFFSALYHFVKWSSRFGSFGFRSRLIDPDLLTNAKGIHIGPNVQIRKGARLEAIGPTDGKIPKLSIGANTVIHLYFHCGAAESVKIGSDVLIAGGVFISDHDHVFDHPDKPARWSGELRTQPVVVKDGVWVGEGAVILKGVTVGERAVVGANAVVTRDVPPYSVVGGNPARLIKSFTVGNTESGTMT